ncbi:MAG: DUF4091 domain-containing protein [Acidobacteriota bacterium]|nr:MAG: DUF4091 domain-containing protein [Acidobacteriota bacterium]
MISLRRSGAEFFLWLLALTLLCNSEPRGEIVEAWAVGDGEKVFRFDPEHPSRERNSIWDGEKIQLKGLYNEILAFQIIVVADNRGAKSVEVSVTPPRNHTEGFSIGGTTPGLYGSGGSIEVFSQHYIQVRNPTPPSWVYASSTAAPEEMTGWIPDALIPPNAIPGRGGMPLDIPPTQRTERRVQKLIEIVPAAPRQNQGFWIDLHLPRDRSFPDGLYSSFVQVRSEGQVVASIPLEVTLLPFYLPDENHSNVWMFSGDVEPYFPELSAAQVERMIKFEGHRHRIDMVGGFKVNRSSFDEKMMDDYSGYLNGDFYRPGNGYSGPGEGKGEKLFPIGMYGALTRTAFTDKMSAQAESDLWVSWFEKNAPDVIFFWYIIDEPGEVQFPWIIERAEWIHQNPGPGSRLPVFTTRSFTEGLSGAINLWAGNENVSLDSAQKARSEGQHHWFYNGKRPHWGSTVVEMAAVDLRMIPWVQYIAQIETWFYWHGTQWYHNWQGPKGHLHQRVFSAPVTFTSDGTDLCNGEGVMFYPGRMPFYPDEDRGLNALLPSIRLKNIRRGRQDYEIMYLAEQVAGREAVLKIIRGPLPSILDEAEHLGPTPWSTNGNDYDRAREELLLLLEKESSQ